MAATLPARSPSGVFPQTTTSSPLFTPSPSGIRKRRAASPPPSDPQYATGGWDNPSVAPLPAKRRRPNLTNGFSGLSLSHVPTHDPNAPGPSSLPSYSQSQREDFDFPFSTEDTDEDLGSSGLDSLFARNDVEVEELPYRMRHPHRTASTSSSSEGTEDSDATATFPRLRRRRTQQADAVEQPMDEPEPQAVEVDQDLGVEDVTPRSRKRRSTSVDADDERQGGSKRMREGMDIDMGTEIEEIPRGRRGSEWYEPEKDRIIYTRLSESPSRSSERERSSSPPVQLSQPGTNGFTISPSMLTRLLAATKDSSIPFPTQFPQQREMGLVLYRPLGIQAGQHLNQGDVRGIVREWAGKEGDSGRFEVVDEDEDLTLGDAEMEGQEAGDMDIDM